MVPGCGYTRLNFFTDKVPSLSEAIQYFGSESDAIISALKGPSGDPSSLKWKDTGTISTAVLGGFWPVNSC